MLLRTSARILQFRIENCEGENGLSLTQGGSLGGQGGAQGGGQGGGQLQQPQGQQGQ